MTKFLTLIRPYPSWIAAAIIGVSVLLQLNLAWRDAQTSDEGVHLAAGITYLTNHDFRLNPEHPPLVKLVSAMPLVIVGFNQASDFNTWWQIAGNFYFDSWEANRKFAEALVFDSNNNPDAMLFWGRLGPIGLFTLLLTAVYWCGKTLFGRWAGVVALVLVATNPTLIAHGHFITTDIAAALGVLLTLYALWHYLQKPSLRSALFVGLTLGLALISKFTLIILPIIVFVWLIYLRFTQPKYDSGKLVGHGLWIALIAYGCILLAYTPQWNAPPKVIAETGSLSSSSTPSLQSTQTAIGKIVSLVRPVLIPKDYFKGLILVFSHTQAGHSSYLFGNYSNTGWWYYFPVVAVIKSPLALLISIGLTLALVMKKRIFSASLFLVLSALMILGFAMLSKANLGVRHLAPIFPILALAFGAFTTLKPWRPLVGVICTALLLEAIVTYPHYLAYISPLVGGTHQGPYIVSDSNVDWGQDLKVIADYIQENNVQNPYIDYNWAGDEALRYYGITYRPLSEIKNNKTGYLIISSAALQSSDWSWLKRQKLVTRITPSVYLYSLAP